MTADLTASIHARLLNLAKVRGEDFNLILTRYAIERFLYRLSLGPARDVYWLKGALLFDLWFDVPHRPTRDADFLGFGPIDTGALAEYGTRNLNSLLLENASVFSCHMATILGWVSGKKVAVVSSAKWRITMYWLRSRVIVSLTVLFPIRSQIILGGAPNTRLRS